MPRLSRFAAVGVLFCSGCAQNSTPKAVPEEPQKTVLHIIKQEDLGPSWKPGPGLPSDLADRFASIVTVSITGVQDLSPLTSLQFEVPETDVQTACDEFAPPQGAIHVLGIPRGYGSYHAPTVVARLRGVEVASAPLSHLPTPHVLLPRNARKDASIRATLNANGELVVTATELKKGGTQLVVFLQKTTFLSFAKGKQPLAWINGIRQSDLLAAMLSPATKAIEVRVKEYTTGKTTERIEFKNITLETAYGKPVFRVAQTQSVTTKAGFTVSIPQQYHPPFRATRGAPGREGNLRFANRDNIIGGTPGGWIPGASSKLTLVAPKPSDLGLRTIFDESNSAVLGPLAVGPTPTGPIKTGPVKIVLDAEATTCTILSDRTVVIPIERTNSTRHFGTQ